MRYLSAALLTLLLASCGNRAEPAIKVSEAWTREVAPGQYSAAAFLTILNEGRGDDRLLGANSPAAIEATLHSTTHEGGIARMRMMDDGIAVPAGSTLKFEPSGYHVMLTGLKQPLKAGQTIGLTLDFERSPDRTVAVRILPVTTTDHHKMAM